MGASQKPSVFDLVSGKSRIQLPTQLERAEFCLEAIKYWTPYFNLFPNFYALRETLEEKGLDGNPKWIIQIGFTTFPDGINEDTLALKLYEISFVESRDGMHRIYVSRQGALLEWKVVFKDTEVAIWEPRSSKVSIVSPARLAKLIEDSYKGFKLFSDIVRGLENYGQKVEEERAKSLDRAKQANQSYKEVLNMHNLCELPRYSTK